MNNKNTLLSFLAMFVVSVTAPNVLGVNVNNTSENSDGISSKIDASKLKGLEDWLYNLKLDIQRDVTQLEKAEVGDKEAMLYSALQRAFKSAGIGTEEFLTRNILIRGIEVYNEMLAKDMGSDNEPKRSAFARRFLELHLRWAGELAPLDKKLLETLKDPYKISETEQRVEIGMEWAQKMVALSFSLPTNEAHYKFLMKTMGYLFNDIVDDDRYNRKLASTARVFVEKYQEQQSKSIQRPLEYLEEAKDFREFLLDEFKILSQNNVTINLGTASIPVATLSDDDATRTSTKENYLPPKIGNGDISGYEWYAGVCMMVSKSRKRYVKNVNDSYCSGDISGYVWYGSVCKMVSKSRDSYVKNVNDSYCSGDISGYEWYAGVCKMVSKSRKSYVKNVNDSYCSGDISGYEWYGSVCKMVSKSRDSYVKSVNDSYCM